MYLVLATLEWPPRFSFPNPLELVITVRHPSADPATEVRERPQVEAQELQQPKAPPLPESAAPTESATPATPIRPAERVVPMEPPAAPAAARVDWHVELERVAAEVVAHAAAEPQSMHPEFEELRRIAALRYSKPITNQPSSTWREENSFMIRDDPGLVNRHAFGTFEEDMILFTISFGRPRPKNLPWVAAIRARYDYLDKEPDELPVLKATRRTQRDDSR